MTIPNPTLPYAFDALEPAIARASLENHFNNHHKRYVARTNELIAGTPLAHATLDEIVERTGGRKTTSELSNNAAQAWNHDFYWRSMKPNGGGEPTGAIRTQIETDFLGYANFAAKMRKAANAMFGSGWAWLVLDVNKLKIATTRDAKTPMSRGYRPILALDLWEHAYYIDYQSRRAEFIENYLKSLVNWDFANENLGRANIVQMVDRTVGPLMPPRQMTAGN